MVSRLARIWKAALRRAKGIVGKVGSPWEPRYHGSTHRLDRRDPGEGPEAVRDETEVNEGPATVQTRMYVLGVGYPRVLGLDRLEEDASVLGRRVRCGSGTLGVGSAPI